MYSTKQIDIKSSILPSKKHRIDKEATKCFTTTFLPPFALQGRSGKELHYLRKAPEPVGNPTLHNSSIGKFRASLDRAIRGKALGQLSQAQAEFCFIASVVSY